MIRRPPRSTLSSSSAASDVYKRQVVKLWQVLNKKKKTAKGLLWPLGPSMLTRALHRGVVHRCTFEALRGNASGSRNPTFHLELCVPGHNSWHRRTLGASPENLPILCSNQLLI